MNPILPLNEFIPDGEVHRFSDGRAYIYGSRDICGNELRNSSLTTEVNNELQRIKAPV